MPKYNSEIKGDDEIIFFEKLLLTAARVVNRGKPLKERMSTWAIIDQYDNDLHAEVMGSRRDPGRFSAQKRKTMEREQACRGRLALEMTYRKEGLLLSDQDENALLAPPQQYSRILSDPESIVTSMTKLAKKRGGVLVGFRLKWRPPWPRFFDEDIEEVPQGNSPSRERYVASVVLWDWPTQDKPMEI